MISSDFHYNENDGTIGVVHFIQTFFFLRKTRLLRFVTKDLYPEVDLFYDILDNERSIA